MNRRRYIDWARGLAVVCMMVHHTFDAFLRTDLRDGPWGAAFRFLGGVAAPGFLFLAGLAVALTLERAAAKGTPRADLIRKGAVRGAGIFVAALVFRAQEWALAYPWSPASDMLRVDVLNTIGIALIAVAVLWGARSPLAFLLAAVAVIAVTPMLWDANPGHSLLWSYLAGRPPEAIFPLFPWLAHALLGAVAGMLLARTQKEGRLIAVFAVAGLVAWGLAAALDHAPHDWRWWNISPAYLAMRTASNLWILAAFWVLERAWQPAFADPLLKLGQHSLAVYWVHVELVYGRWFWRARGNTPLLKAFVAFGLVAGSMVVLAYAIAPAKKLWARRKAVRDAFVLGTAQ